MYCVEIFRLLLTQLRVFHSNNTESSIGDHLNNISNVIAFNSIWLNHREGSISRHSFFVLGLNSAAKIAKKAHETIFIQKIRTIKNISIFVSTGIKNLLMKKSWKYLAGTTMVGSLLFFTACGDEKPTETITEPVANDPVEQVESLDIVDVESFGVDLTMEYRVPTPNEFIESVALYGGEPNFSLLNAPGNAEGYSDKKTKALNFGVYSADLTFGSYYGMSQDLLQYFGAVNQLSEDLGIASAVDMTLKDKMEQFLSEGLTDSVQQVSDNTYYQAYKYLEDNDRGSTLAMVVAGAWLEGLYLMTNMVKEYKANDPIVSAIAGQSFTVENIYGFLNKYSDDANVVTVMSDLEPIANILAELDFVETEEQMEEEDGVMIISDGAAITITEQQFKKLKEEVSSLRNSITE